VVYCLLRSDELSLIFSVSAIYDCMYVNGGTSTSASLVCLFCFLLSSLRENKDIETETGMVVLCVVTCCHFTIICCVGRIENGMTLVEYVGSPKGRVVLKIYTFVPTCPHAHTSCKHTHTCAQHNKHFKGV